MLVAILLSSTISTAKETILMKAKESRVRGSVNLKHIVVVFKKVRKIVVNLAHAVVTKKEEKKRVE